MKEDLKPFYNVVNQLVGILLNDDVIVATKYISPKLIIRATRKRYRSKIDLRQPFEVMLTMGKPNYAEREFIQECKRSGVSFPVKKIRLKPYKIRK